MLLAALALLSLPAHATRTVRVQYVQAPAVLPPAGVERLVVLDGASLATEHPQAVQAAMARFQARGREAHGLQVVWVPMAESGVRDSHAWGDLARLCRTHDADAVVTLEDLSWDDGRVALERTKQVEEREGREVEYTLLTMQRTVEATSRWRYVQPAKRQVIDELGGVRRTATLSSSGRARIPTRKHLDDQLPAARQRLGASSADAYASRILPVKVAASRTFFANGKLKEGRRYASVGKWVQARKAWRRVMDNGRRSGRKARYNVALTHEVTGDLERALEVLDPLVGTWDKRLVVSYRNALRDRLRNERLLAGR